MFRNLLIADSGKGHVEEMIRMLRDVPGFASARLNLLHVVSDQNSSNLQEHWQQGGALLAEAVQRLGLNPGEVNTICLLYTSPSPRDRQKSRMPSSA